jgi:hypothetical protein
MSLLPATSFDPATPPISILLASTFACELVASELRALLSSLGLPARVTAAPYGALPAWCADASSPWHGASTHLCIGLLRCEDLTFAHPELRAAAGGGGSSGGGGKRGMQNAGALLHPPPAGCEAASAAALRALWGAGFAGHRAAGGGRALLCACPSPPAWYAGGGGGGGGGSGGGGGGGGSGGGAWGGALRELHAGAASCGASVLPDAWLAAAFEGRPYYDAASDLAAHAPYPPPAAAALALALARWVVGSVAPQRKVLVLDCDNTLWGGVAGEGARGGAHLALGGCFAALRAAAAGAARRGVPLTLATRNERGDVEAVFEARARELALGDVLLVEAGWGEKSAALRRIARRLALPLDALLLVDDSPVECGEVAGCGGGAGVAWLPPPWGEDGGARGGALLEHAWALDGVRGGVGGAWWGGGAEGARAPHAPPPPPPPLTPEDEARSDFYKVHLARAELRAGAGSFAAFLASLAVRVAIEPLCGATLPRAAQLTVRTNQLNALKAPLSEAALAAAWLRPHPAPPAAWTVCVSDRFGAYGVVGLMALAQPRGAGEHAEVPLFLLSCRVMCRGVEHAMVRFLAAAAAGVGVGAGGALRFAWAPTPRNEPMRRFLWGLPGAAHVVAAGEEGVAEGACAADAEARARDAEEYLLCVLGAPPPPPPPPPQQQPLRAPPRKLCKFGEKCLRLGVDEAHAAAFEHSFLFQGSPFALPLAMRGLLTEHQACAVFRAARERALRAADRAFLGGLPPAPPAAGAGEGGGGGGAGGGPAHPPARGWVDVPLAAAAAAALDAARVGAEEEEAAAGGEGAAEGAPGGAYPAPHAEGGAAPDARPAQRRGHFAAPHTYGLHFETLAGVAALCASEGGIWGAAEALLRARAARGAPAGAGEPAPAGAAAALLLRGAGGEAGDAPAGAAFRRKARVLAKAAESGGAAGFEKCLGASQG